MRHYGKRVRIAGYTMWTEIDGHRSTHWRMALVTLDSHSGQLYVYITSSTPYQSQCSMHVTWQFLKTTAETKVYYLKYWRKLIPYLTLRQNNRTWGFYIFGKKTWNGHLLIYKQRTFSDSLWNHQSAPEYKKQTTRFSQDGTIHRNYCTNSFLTRQTNAGGVTQIEEHSFTFFGLAHYCYTSGRQ